MTVKKLIRSANRFIGTVAIRCCRREDVRGGRSSDDRSRRSDRTLGRDWLRAAALLFGSTEKNLTDKTVSGAATLSRATQGVGRGAGKRSKDVRRAYAVQVKGVHQTFRRRELHGAQTITSGKASLLRRWVEQIWRSRGILLNRPGCILNPNRCWRIVGWMRVLASKSEMRSGGDGIGE